MRPGSSRSDRCSRPVRTTTFRESVQSTPEQDILSHHLAPSLGNFPGGHYCPRTWTSAALASHYPTLDPFQISFHTAIQILDGTGGTVFESLLARKTPRYLHVSSSYEPITLIGCLTEAGEYAPFLLTGIK